MKANIFLDEEIEQFKEVLTNKSDENQEKLRTIIEEITYQTLIKELSLEDAEKLCCKLFKYYSELKP